jgi:hypothetical protein
VGDSGDDGRLLNVALMPPLASPESSVPRRKDDASGDKSKCENAVGGGKR